MITIRFATPDDAAAFLALRHQVDEETRFMMLEPGERQSTVEQERERLINVARADNKQTFLAEEAGQLIGWLWANGGDFRRNRHNVHIVIGILEAHTGQGVGRRLFEACEQWARDKQLHRLELTVMTHNVRGIALYKKMGFEIEGTAQHAMQVDGQYVALHYMYKLLA
ncbi:MAG: GNAT family N-acetyltransferase [Thermoflexales bacterium]|nr:GNAT family N-acetyltransferase [Thermoflexales bacterium]